MVLGAGGAVGVAPGGTSTESRAGILLVDQAGAQPPEWRVL